MNIIRQNTLGKLDRDCLDLELLKLIESYKRIGEDLYGSGQSFLTQRIQSLSNRNLKPEKQTKANSIDMTGLPIDPATTTDYVLGPTRDHRNTNIQSSTNSELIEQ